MTKRLASRRKVWFQTQEAECDVEQGILTQQTDPLALCHADLRQEVDR